MELRRLSPVAVALTAGAAVASAEAIRTGDVHGIEISQNTQKITVYKADLLSSPVGQAAVLYHPVTKHLGESRAQFARWQRL